MWKWKLWMKGSPLLHKIKILWGLGKERIKEKLVILPGNSLARYRSRDVGPNQVPRRNSENSSKCHQCRPYVEDRFPRNVDHSRDVGPKSTQQIMLLCLAWSLKSQIEIAASTSTSFPYLSLILRWNRQIDLSYSPKLFARKLILGCRSGILIFYRGTTKKCRRDFILIAPWPKSIRPLGASSAYRSISTLTHHANHWILYILSAS